MKTKHKVLIVDDDKNYAQSLIDPAYKNYDIELHHCEDWETAESRIIKNPDEFRVIIIDGKGKLKQEEKEENSRHLHVATSFLKSLREKGIYIPYVINTGYFEELSKYFGNEIMIDKKDTDKLFAKIKELIESSEENKIREKYSDVFACFSPQYLPKEAEDNLLEVLLEIENNKWSASSLNTLRKIVESIYIKLHEYDDELIPYGCLRYENNKVNLKYCELRLTGKEIRENGTILYPAIKAALPVHLCLIVGPITKVCNMASHPDLNKISKYYLQGITFALMEMILWFKKYVDENYKKK